MGYVHILGYHVLINSNICLQDWVSYSIFGLGQALESKADCSHGSSSSLSAPLIPRHAMGFHYVPQIQSLTFRLHTAHVPFGHLGHPFHISQASASSVSRPNTISKIKIGSA